MRGRQLSKKAPLIYLLGVVVLLAAAADTTAASESTNADPGELGWTPDVGPSPVSLAGASSAWAFAFGSPQTDWANDLVPLDGGDFVAVGFVNRTDGAESDWDGIAQRFSSEGHPIWTRRLGGSGLDALWSGVETADGRLALVGFSASGGAGGTDVWLLLLDGDGTVVAERRFGGPGGERGIDVVPAADGGLLLVGQTDSTGAGESDVYLVRTDAEGREVWTKTWGGPGIDRGFYGVPARDGGFVVSGVTGEPGSYDMIVVKVDAAGEEVWHRVLGGPGNDPNHGLNALPAGRVVVVGYTESWGARENDIVAITLSAGGGLLTIDAIGGPGDDRAMSSYTAPDGRTWVIGETTSLGAGGRDVMLMLLGAAGRFEPWMAAVGTAGEDRGGALALTEEGHLILAGDSNALGGGSGPSDLLLARVDPEALERSEDVTTRPLWPPDILVRSVGGSPSRSVGE